MRANGTGCDAAEKATRDSRGRRRDGRRHVVGPQIQPLPLPHLAFPPSCPCWSPGCGRKRDKLTRAARLRGKGWVIAASIHQANSYLPVLTCCLVVTFSP